METTKIASRATLSLMSESQFHIHDRVCFTTSALHGSASQRTRIHYPYDFHVVDQFHIIFKCLIIFIPYVFHFWKTPNLAYASPLSTLKTIDLTFISLLVHNYSHLCLLFARRLVFPSTGRYPFPANCSIAQMNALEGHSIGQNCCFPTVTQQT